MKSLRIITAIACLFILSNLVTAPLYAATPTPTPKPANSLPNRLFKAKQVARNHVERRQKELNRLKAVINKYDVKMLKADVATLETSIAEMENNLKSWRKEINDATEVDALKALHKEWFKKTRVFGVFRPKINQLIRLSVNQKNSGRLNKRITNQENGLKTKKNVDGNTQYEQVQAMIEESRRLHDKVKAAVESLKTKVQAYNSTDYNADPAGFRSRAKATSDEIRGVGKDVSSLFKITKQSAERLAKLPNL